MWFKFKFRGLEIRQSAHTGSRTAALKAERARRNELDEGASAIKTVKPLLFSKAAKDWLSLKEVHWTASTRRSEGYNVDHLLPHFGTRFLTDITAKAVTRYQAARKSAGASGRTINMETCTLRAVLRKHRLWAAIQPDVKPLAARSDAVSRDEEIRLLAAARKSRSRSLYPGLVVAFHTGLRNAELRNLCWRQVDLIEAHLTVGKSKTAGGEGRVVPLSGTACAVLKEWRAQFPDAEPSNYVFPYERAGGKGHKFGKAGTAAGRVAYDTDPTKPIGSWRTAFNTAKKTAAVSMRMHDTRHTFCSRSAEAGAPEQTLIAMAGWMSRKMLETYSHTCMEAKRRVVESFGLPAEILEGGTKVGTVH